MTEHDPARELVEPSIAPCLSVADGPGAVDYYTAAFGAVDRYRLEDDTGRVVVAQLAIGQADFGCKRTPTPARPWAEGRSG